MSNVNTKTGKPLTGKKVLLIAVMAFGTIIAVNLTLAFNAVRTFPGIEVKNGYIASQTFEAERLAQVRLGWSATAAYDGTRLTIEVTDRKGAPATMKEATFRIGRATTEASDLTPHLSPTATGWAGDMALAPGIWRVDVAAISDRGEPFRQKLFVRGQK